VREEGATMIMIELLCCVVVGSGIESGGAGFVMDMVNKEKRGEVCETHCARLI
jgi:hypothetical protein